MSKQTAIVTGGAGFLGSHLCEKLVDRGWRVLCVDNLITGRLENVEHLQNNEDFAFLNFDVIEPLDCKAHPWLAGQINFVFHLASPASPVDYQRFAVETALVNSIGTYNLLEWVREKSAGFLFTSTSEAYGDPLEHPQKETYRGNVNPIGPRAIYDEGKRFGEAITFEFIRKFDLDARVVRIFNTYGPRMKIGDGRVVPNFIKQALAGEPLTVYGDGSQTRSFCYVDDLTEGLVKMAFIDSARGELVNLGNPDEYTILQFAKKIIELTESSSQIIYESLPPDDPTRRRPDISKAESLLGWKAKVGLEQGLGSTIKYFKGVLAEQ